VAASLEPLRKILELEQRKGYEDTAVIGGLNRFLRNCAVQVTEAIPDRSLLRRFQQLVSRTDYASLSVSQRREWVQGVFNLIAEIEGGAPASTEPEEKASPAPKTRRAKAVKAAAPVGGTGLDSPITTVRGISTSLATKFGKLGVKTVRDLLHFFPHRHLDYSQIKHISQLVEGDEQTIIANVWQAQATRLGYRQGTEAIVGDETGNVRAVWFNQPYLAKRLPTNARIVLSGRVSLFKGRHVFESPEWEYVEDKDLVHTGRLVPVYSLTQGLYPRQVRKLMKDAVDEWAWQVEDFLPAVLRERCDFLELSQAISQAHYPEDEIIKDRARVRLAFDELFILQLGVMERKHDWQEAQPGSAFTIDKALLNNFIEALPFKLTEAQQRVLGEMLGDMQRPQPMSRLLQGEVGSGKTVVATAALLMAVANGYQGAFMAPTEILAEQHFATLCGLLSGVGSQGEGEEVPYIKRFSGITSRPLTVALLIGDVTQSQKQELQQRINEGDIDIAIGTHALIQKGVDFKKMGLAVVDEQHRFGVTQRSALRQKGFKPHMLVMTATPIPRTLALTLYGDLDLSVIDELPPGRQTVKTKWLRPGQRESAYGFIRKQISAGHQAFIICPLIEESEAIAAQAAVVEYERLSHEVFTDLRLGLLHGRLSGEEKDDVMQRFRERKLDILVSTPVVEVGIDIPNATVMLIESADRFGLSQLHQFRGRVGRGEEQSYCMLLAENPSEVGRERLDVIENVQDGFVLAEEDLKMRGPGEFFGTRQSGLPDLRMARLSDVKILELARNEAIGLYRVDPGLKAPEHQLLAREMARVWPKSNAGEWS
jgi:ATP-dependent DNA helicase RecG